MPESLTRRESAYLNLGVSGFTSESRPASPRNIWPASVGICNLVLAMGLSGITKSQVSRLCAEIDYKAKTFLQRPLENTPRPRVYALV